jgi:hypothetical protein
MKIELMDRPGNGNANARETLFLLGGAALIVVGAGMVLSHPAVRQYVEKSSLGNVFSHIIPDVERYFRLRSM